MSALLEVLAARVNQALITAGVRMVAARRGIPSTATPRLTGALLERSMARQHDSLLAQAARATRAATSAAAQLSLLLALASCQTVVVNVGEGSAKEGTVIFEPHIEKEKKSAPQPKEDTER